jgi:hypothetical protein
VQCGRYLHFTTKVPEDGAEDKRYDSCEK